MWLWIKDNLWRSGPPPRPTKQPTTTVCGTNYISLLKLFHRENTKCRQPQSATNYGNRDGRSRSITSLWSAATWNAPRCETWWSLTSREGTDAPSSAPDTCRHDNNSSQLLRTWEAIYYYYLLSLLKPAAQAKVGKPKLCINCLRNPTSTCVTENLKNKLREQPTIDWSLKNWKCCRCWLVLCNLKNY